MVPTLLFIEVLDYRALSASGTLSSAVSEQCFTIVIIDDTAVENEEVLGMFISVSPKLHNVYITQQNVSIWITDDDGWFCMIR